MLQVYQYTGPVLGALLGASPVLGGHKSRKRSLEKRMEFGLDLNPGWANNHPELFKPDEFDELVKKYRESPGSSGKVGKSGHGGGESSLEAQEDAHSALVRRGFNVFGKTHESGGPSSKREEHARDKLKQAKNFAKEAVNEMLEYTQWIEGPAVQGLPTWRVGYSGQGHEIEKQWLARLNKKATHSQEIFDKVHELLRQAKEQLEAVRTYRLGRIQHGTMSGQQPDDLDLPEGDSKIYKGVQSRISWVEDRMKNCVKARSPVEDNSPGSMPGPTEQARSRLRNIEKMQTRNKNWLANFPTKDEEEKPFQRVSSSESDSDSDSDSRPNFNSYGLME